MIAVVFWKGTANKHSPHANFLSSLAYCSNRHTTHLIFIKKDHFTWALATFHVKPNHLVRWLVLNFKYMPHNTISGLLILLLPNRPSANSLELSGSLELWATLGFGGPHTPESHSASSIGSLFPPAAGLRLSSPHQPPFASYF